MIIAILNVPEMGMLEKAFWVSQYGLETIPWIDSRPLTKL